jgi:ketosteroid isomerase-like protein
MALPTEYFAMVLQIRDGKITRGVEYCTREDALDAAGLSAPL